MAEPHQPPYSLQQQQQQGMAAWYGASPHAYQQAQQAPGPPPQHHAMPWSVAPPPPPPGEQPYNYLPQPYHPPPQNDFYPQQQQVHHQYPPPPQPAQPQFTYMYGQQDQVWQANNNSWGYQQWPYPAQNASLSQEEVWAAKARAWAASKAVQDEPRSGVNAPQMYQDYMYQPQEPHPLEGQHHSLQPPGEEGTNVPYYQNNTISQSQNVQPRSQSEHPPQNLSYDQPLQDIIPSVIPESVVENLEPKATQIGRQPQSNDIQSVFGSSHGHDAAANYRLDTAITGAPGTDRPEPIPQLPPKQLAAAPMYTQQATPLLPQSQASPLIAQPRLMYSDKLSSSGYEHQQQQVPSSYLQPPPPPQQPPAQAHHQPQKVPLQAHYHSSVTMEGVDGEFGLSPRSLQNWAPVGGPGMPFPPAMGAGSSQFDPLHTPHQIPVPWRPDGGGLQGLGFSSSAPFVVGSSPGLGPGVGTPVRPLFTPDSYIERPKKAAVPSWLREELMKKKAAGLAGNATGMLLSDESSRVNGGEPAISLSQRVGISDKLRSSSPGLSEDEEEDQEEEIEAARNAAINQEIKRLLTEVLLKVTGDLFEEIAQEVLDEDSDYILQGESSPDERSRVVKFTSPPSPGAGPPSSGRVFVPSVKNPATGDSDREKDSSDSGVIAGDVLGLGNYASDDETLGSKDYQEPLHSLETKTEIHDSLPLDLIDQGKYRVGADAHGRESADGSIQSLESAVQNMKRVKEDDTSKDTQPKVVKQEKEEGEKGRQHEVGKPQLQKEDNNISSAQSGGSPIQKDLGSDLGASIKQDRVSTSKEEQSRAHLSSSYPDHREPVSDQDGKNTSTVRSNSMLKGERQHEDTVSDTLTKLVSGKGSARPAVIHPIEASFQKLENHDIGLNQDSFGKEKRKEEKREEKAKDLSSKERKREEKPKARLDSSSKEKNIEERDERLKIKPDTSGKQRNTEEKNKDNKEAKQARGSDAQVRDCTRDRRKEKDKVKEKSKTRERESDRDRRKQDKREREGRSRRTDAVEKKARHRSTSSSSSRGREGNFSSNSEDKSRGRIRARRSSRHHVSTSSPGRSRKRRASRSRSRSRSPHVKHTHRRNVPSPSHEKSRRSGSKSPVHRRGRG